MRGSKTGVSEWACVEEWEDRVVIVFSFNPLIFPFEEESNSFLWKSGYLKTNKIMLYESEG